MRKDKEEKAEKQQSLLERLCKADEELYAFLSKCLYDNPLAALPETDLDSLISQAKSSEDFRKAIDKAIFEASQNPAEKEEYIKKIKDLANLAIQATQKEKEEMEHQRHTDLATSLAKRIENHQLISARTEDIIEIASKYYKERLLQLEEEEMLEERERGRKQIEKQERIAESKQRST
jgi:hypothetical protein